MIKKIKTKNREEWLELRSHYIGGSDAAAVAGLNPWSTPYSLWAEKTGRKERFQGNLATDVGTYLEEFVAQRFTSETRKKVRRMNLSMINDQYPFAIANIDRAIVGEKAGLEIKTTDSLNLKKFAHGEYPATYYCQMVHYLAVTGWDRWYLAVLVGNKEFHIYTLDRDQDEIDALMEAENNFWAYVEQDAAPPVDGYRPTTEALSELYPYSSNEGSVSLDAWQGDMERYMTLSKEIKDLERQRDEISNSIKEYMHTSEFGSSDKYRVSWKTSERTSFDSKRYISDHPELDLSKYYRHTSTRIFRLTERK